ncbi:histone methyltransferase involved in gene regulation [Scheffersomyces stipitis CBS 6054]|uniref:Histone-lysine N-methyltransferase, H3 lysine-4 specific n=1 Tax=Scheffersomyces stipitis (strain ATCC 58785 / CBS 6054 / NBRC 10063 / NRRL Y-11545) TaxID=322104 RepID=A3LX95_PICST|nr:histone methyltransferase involved in gene regulation [Scheffersomyces stipitis CBS 6054]ABN67763.2 histone methyltransferase involved in gene regulation [Scheffersomyces stipitis CBS 6054]
MSRHRGFRRERSRYRSFNNNDYEDDDRETNGSTRGSRYPKDSRYSHNDSGNSQSSSVRLSRVPSGERSPSIASGHGFKSETPDITYSNIPGTDPVTGENSADKNFTKLLHHIDFLGKFPQSRDTDVRKNYRVVYDPELDKSLTKEERKSRTKKIRFNGESLPFSERTDPRTANLQFYFQRPNKKSKKFPFKQLPQPKFAFDKDSLGPAPQTELVVWDLPATTNEVYLTNYFKSYGDPIQDMKFVNDPINAVPLGIATFKFQGPPEKAMRLAKKLISIIRVEGAKVDGVDLRIALNDNDNNLLKNKIDLARDKLRASRQKREEEERRRLRRQQEEERAKRDEERKAAAESKRREEEAKVEKLQHQKTSGKNHSKFKPNTSTLSIRHHNKVVPGVFLPKELVKYIKDRPYIVIHDKYVSAKKVSSQDIKRALNKYDWTRVLSDRTGFFIVFNSLKECERCFFNEDGKRFFEFRLYMELAIPEGYDTSSIESAEDLLELQNKKHDILEEATNILIKEFETFLAKDIRERIIAPAVLDLLSHDKYPKLVEELKAKENASKPTSFVSTNDQLKQSALSILAGRKSQQSQSLPSFKKKVESPTKNKPLRKSLIPMQHALNYDHDSDEEDEDDSSRSATPAASILKRERSSTVTTVNNEDNEEQPSKKQKTGLQKSFLYESSSDEEMEDEDVSDGAASTMVINTEELELKDEGDVKKEAEDKAEEDIDYSKFEARYHPTERKPYTVYAETNLLPTDNFNLDVLQDVLKDEEDIKLAKEVLQETNPPSSDIRNIDYWAWKQKDISGASQEIVEDAELIEKLDSRLESQSGAFRSDGYRRIPDVDKIEYLPHRRKVHKPLQTVQHEEVEEEAGNRNNEGTNSAIQSSRVNRANNRRFAADITAQLGNETEVLSLNTLTKRKKPVSFARSAIHNWGLYALEPIAAKEMIIEYVGESIRQQVAEHREKSYLKTGIGSSYLFRIDENTVIDATKKGGIARFINHCCSPSCTAKIIKVDNQKRIVIYALRDIDANEELTYDYKFERETNDAERIRCLCGAPGCKGYLN